MYKTLVYIDNTKGIIQTNIIAQGPERVYPIPATDFSRQLSVKATRWLAGTGFSSETSNIGKCRI